MMNNVVEPDWKRVGKYPSITPRAFDALGGWLRQTISGGSPDAQLLLIDLPQSSIQSAVLVKDEIGPPAIAVMLSDPKQNSPRYVDLETFCLMRLMVAFGGRFRINNDHKPNPFNQNKPHFYFTISLPGLANVALNRIVADVEAGRRIVQKRRRAISGKKADTHYDNRVQNLTIENAPPTRQGPKPTRRTRRGRPQVFRAAIEGLRRYGLKHGRKNGFPPFASTFASMLNDAAMLLDKRRGVHPVRHE